MWTSIIAIGMAFASGPGLDQTLAQHKDLRSARLAEGVPAIPQDAYQDALEGEVVVGLVKAPGQDVSKSWAVAVLDVPIDRMWAAIADESKHTEGSPARLVSRVTGSACESGRIVFQSIGVPLVSDRWYFVERQHNAEVQQKSQGAMRELYFRTVEPGSWDLSDQVLAEQDNGIRINFAEGAWLLMKHGDKTLVEYYTWADPGGKLSPDAMSMFAGRSTRKLFRNMEAIAQRDDLYCR